ncbi:MAG: hypothetical protein PSV17_03170 [Methylotenera sp.]|uniref:hypothetical protein n=1 Tax=Methylotenera sp. TaxID=2051956 RepID=UPI00248856F7|nr:hypothetical protein [Methylotenera sp.]MDI1308420.1 hypothetical protein [Methylotenera sp.]
MMVALALKMSKLRRVDGAKAIMQQMVVVVGFLLAFMALSCVWEFEKQVFMDEN